MVAVGLAAALAGCSTPTSATVSALPPSTTGVSINQVEAKYFDDAAFRRISEYFDGVENKGGRIIERTDPKERAGFYFVLDLAWNYGLVLPKGTLARVDYIRKDDPTPRVAQFTFSDDTGTWPEIFLGLTGADWPSKDLSIIAYKITLTDSAGKTLAEKASFLWELPPEPAAATVAAENPPSSNSAPAPAPAKSAP
jgi:hypothetical protein